jgi:hypothetical protein
MATFMAASADFMVIFVCRGFRVPVFLTPGLTDSLFVPLDAFLGLESAALTFLDRPALEGGCLSLPVTALTLLDRPVLESA